MRLLLLAVLHLCASHPSWAVPTDDADDYQQSQNISLRFATECVTPNQEKGLCLDVGKCPAFARMTLTPEHSAYDFFVASKCSPKNAKAVKVCCGARTNFDSQIPKQQHTLEDIDEVDPLPRECGKQKLLTFNSRVLGGVEAAIGEFPWMGRLVHKDRTGYEEYGCSAFLIHDRFAVTAAHCINSKLLRLIGPVFSIVLGDHDSSSAVDCFRKKCAPPPQVIRVGTPIVYSGYDTESGNHNNDIALIPLRKSANFTNFVGPICLLDKKGAIDTFTISGWGKTKTVEASQVKMKVDLDRFPMQRCVELYKARGVLLNRKNQLCAGGVKDQDSCTGDSGGPLMVAQEMTTWYAEGVVSFGFGCGEAGVPGVYTNIPTYVPWIRKTIARKMNKPKKPRVKPANKTYN